VTPWPIVVTTGLVGAVVASYVTTAAMRATDEDAASSARSQCDGCRRVLSWPETLPLASFAALGGRCRTCSAAISPLHPAGEAAGLLAGALIALAAPDYRAVALGLMAVMLLAASIIDVRIRILPDSMIGVVAVVGTILAASDGLEAWTTGIVVSVAMLLVFGAVSLGFERLRGRVGLGMGDVKLIAALSLWLGLAAPWAVFGAMALGLVKAAIAPPADGKITAGPLIAAAGFAIGLVMEAGLWPAL
jgi:leader peptidase (prepilin peptidase) / N-methyltransferase